MPHGRVPALTFLTALVARSMNDTSFDGPFAVTIVVPPGSTPTPHGRCPASIELDDDFFEGSTRNRRPNEPAVTYTVEPSGLTAIPIGRAFGVAPFPSS